MLSDEQLRRLRRECERELATPPEIAEYLEERADWITTRAESLAVEPANADDPANDGPLRLARPGWSIDRLVQALGARLVERQLPAMLLGAFVRADMLVIVPPDLHPNVRTIVVPHECSHCALHPRAPHAEVWYLTLCLLFPRRLLDRLPPGRQPTASALAQLVPYRVASWAAEFRALQLSRAWSLAL